MRRTTSFVRSAVIVSATLGLASAALPTGYDLFDSQGNRLFHIGLQYQGTSVVGRTIYDGFEGSEYILRKTVPAHDPQGRVTVENHLDFEDTKVNWATYTHGASSTTFQLLDYFAKGNRVYSGSYAAGASGTYTFQGAAGNTHSLKYTTGTDGAVSRIDINDAAGTLTHYVLSSGTSSIGGAPGAAAVALPRMRLAVHGRDMVALDLSLEQPEAVEVALFDTRGRMITRLEHGQFAAGGHRLRYGLGEPNAAAGVALVRATAGSQTLVHPLHLAGSGSGGGSAQSRTARVATHTVSSALAKGTRSMAAEALPPSLITELLYFYDELPGASRPAYLGPVDVVANADGSALYVAERAARRLDKVDPVSGTITASTLLPNQPTGLALSADGSKVYVTCYSDKRPMGVLCEVDAASVKVNRAIPAGHSPRGPSVGPGGVVYICNQFSDKVSVIDPTGGAPIRSLLLAREPFSSAVTPDGKTLVVTNYLPAGRSDIDTVAAVVSLISTATFTEEKRIELCNGAQSLADVCISPDGKYAYVTHIRSLHTITPLNKIEQGWINANAVSVIDMVQKKYLSPFLLDDFGSGAANPWGVVCTQNQLVVTSAGSAEIHVIDRTKLHTAMAAASDDLAMSLSFSRGFTLRQATTVKGPREIALAGTMLYIVGYFSDQIQATDIATGRPVGTRTLNLGPTIDMDPVRKGEYNFWEAKHMCLQSWQSCASCHPGARSDALKWDLENDGLGNFKNDKSLLYAHITPPVMITGVRQTAEVATRAGVKLILFIEPSSVEEEAAAIDEYLKSLRHVPSPNLDNGALDAAAQRGKRQFTLLECNTCHVARTYYTDFEKHPGIKGPGDTGPLDGNWDTPTLYEIWRSGPYMHDGRSATLEEIFKTPVKHGVGTVNPSDLADLVAYLNSL